MDILKKSDFSQKKLLELQSNKSILVHHETFKELESTRVMVALTKNRFPEHENTFRTDRVSDSFDILITAVAK